jgi:hypothetical protein
MLITGNTYPHRATLRAMGGDWNAAKKGWEVPEERAEEARALVAGGDQDRAVYGVGRRGRSRYGSSYTRFQGGGEVYTNRAGRCLDAPCCGCCS